MATFRSIHLLLVAAALMAALLPPNVCAQDEGAYEDDSGVSDPVVTSLSASSGAMTGGTRLELNGDNFGVPVPLGPPVNEVVLVTADGGQRPCIVEQFSSRQDRIVCETTPSDVEGPADIYVTVRHVSTDSGAGIDSVRTGVVYGGFTYSPGNTPIVTAAVPGVVTPGDQVFLQGHRGSTSSLSGTDLSQVGPARLFPAGTVAIDAAKPDLVAASALCSVADEADGVALSTNGSSFLLACHAATAPGTRGSLGEPGIKGVSLQLFGRWKDLGTAVADPAGERTSAVHRTADGVPYTAAVAPRVDSVTASMQAGPELRGSTAGSQRITVTGAGLGGAGVQVSVGGAPCVTDEASDAKLVCLAPPAADMAGPYAAYGQTAAPSGPSGAPVQMVPGPAQGIEHTIFRKPQDPNNNNIRPGYAAADVYTIRNGNRDSEIVQASAVQHGPFSYEGRGASHLTEAMAAATDAGEDQSQTDYYAARLRSFYVPPSEYATSANQHTFFVAGDDNVLLWVSDTRTGAYLAANTNGNPPDPATAVPSDVGPAALTSSYTSPFQWERHADGRQSTAPLMLEADDAALLDAVFFEGSGLDHAQVGVVISRPVGSSALPHSTPDIVTYRATAPYEGAKVAVSVSWPSASAPTSAQSVCVGHTGISPYGFATWPADANGGEIKTLLNGDDSYWRNGGGTGADIMTQSVAVSDVDDGVTLTRTYTIEFDRDALDFGSTASFGDLFIAGSGCNQSTATSFDFVPHSPALGGSFELVRASNGARVTVPVDASADTFAGAARSLWPDLDNGGVSSVARDGNAKTGYLWTIQYAPVPHAGAIDGQVDPAAALTVDASNVTGPAPADLDTSVVVVSLYSPDLLFLPIPQEFLRAPVTQAAVQAAVGSAVDAGLVTIVADHAVASCPDLVSCVYVPDVTLTPEVTDAATPTGGTTVDPVTENILEVSGTGFGIIAADVRVDLNGAECNIATVTDTLITCTVQEGGTSGIAKVRVGRLGYGNAAHPNGDVEVTLNSLVITGVHPSQVAPTGITVIEITATGVDIGRCLSAHTVTLIDYTPTNPLEANCVVSSCSDSGLTCLFNGDAAPNGFARTSTSSPAGTSTSEAFRVNVNLTYAPVSIDPSSRFEGRRSLQATETGNVPAPADTTTDGLLEVTIDTNSLTVPDALPGYVPYTGNARRRSALALQQITSSGHLAVAPIAGTSWRVGVQFVTGSEVIVSADLVPVILDGFGNYIDDESRKDKKEQLTVSCNTTGTTCPNNDSTGTSAYDALTKVQTITLTLGKVPKATGAYRLQIVVADLEANKNSCNANPSPCVTLADEFVEIVIDVSSVAVDGTNAFIMDNVTTEAVGSVGGGNVLTIAGWGFDPNNSLAYVVVPVSTTFPSGVVECEVDRAKSTFERIVCTTLPYCKADGGGHADEVAATCLAELTAPATVDVVNCPEREGGWDAASSLARLRCWGNESTVRSVTRTWGCSGAGCFRTFEYSTTAAMYVDTVTPTYLQAGAAAITVTGSGLGSATVSLVKPDGTEVACSSTAISTQVDADCSAAISGMMATGGVRVRVTYDDSTSPRHGEEAFYSLHNVAPTVEVRAVVETIVAVSPKDGSNLASFPTSTSALGGQRIRLTAQSGGAIFSSHHVMVRVANLPCLDVEVAVDGSTLECVTPPSTGKYLWQHWALPRGLEALADLTGRTPTAMITSTSAVDEAENPVLATTWNWNAAEDRLDPRETPRTLGPPDFWSERMSGHLYLKDGERLTFAAQGLFRVQIGPTYDANNEGFTHSGGNTCEVFTDAYDAWYSTLSSADKAAAPLGPPRSCNQISIIADTTGVSAYCCGYTAEVDGWVDYTLTFQDVGGKASFAVNLGDAPLVSSRLASAAVDGSQEGLAVMSGGVMATLGPSAPTSLTYASLAYQEDPITWPLPPAASADQPVVTAIAVDNSMRTITITGTGGISETDSATIAVRLGGELLDCNADTGGSGPLICSLDNAPAGIYDVMVLTTVTTVAGDAFLYLPSGSLVVDGVSSNNVVVTMEVTAATGPDLSVDGGTNVVITGSGFSTDPADMTVTVGGVTCIVTSSTPISLGCQTGALSAGSTALEVSVTFGSNITTFTSTLAVTASSVAVSSTSLPSAPNGNISLCLGTLPAGSEYRIAICDDVNGAGCLTATAWTSANTLADTNGDTTDNCITVDASGLAAGGYEATLWDPTLGLATSVPFSFDGGAVVDTSSPTTGLWQTGGAPLTITGTPGWLAAGDASVFVCIGADCVHVCGPGDVPCGNDNTTITTLTPATTLTTGATVEVETHIGGSRVAATNTLSFTSTAAPTVNMVRRTDDANSPAMGGTEGGTDIEITLSSAVEATTVWIGDTQCCIAGWDTASTPHVCADLDNGAQASSVTVTCQVGAPNKMVNDVAVDFSVLREVVVATTLGRTSSGTDPALGINSYEFVDLWSQPSTWNFNSCAPIWASDGSQDAINKWAECVPEGESGLTVFIPAGYNVRLDMSPPKLNALLLAGNLTFDPTRTAIDPALELDADYILLNGGNLTVGTLDEPFMGNAVITLHGTPDQTEMPIYGAKSIGVRKGNLSLVGDARVNGNGIESRTWTRLAASVEADCVNDVCSATGDGTLVLDGGTDDALYLDWRAGDKIVIASSSLMPDDFDEVTIKTVTQTATRTTITYDKELTPLRYDHLGVVIEGDTLNEVTNYTGDVSWDVTKASSAQLLDHRAEVGLLTRNVVVQGDDLSEDNQFGAVIMTHNHGYHDSVVGRAADPSGWINDPTGESSPHHAGMNAGHMAVMKSVMHVVRVEVRQAGQAFRLGRYPIHFHMQGDSDLSRIEGNSIHHTYNRALTVHGSHGVNVKDNVAFNNMGHAFFLEDGIEVENRFERNLAVWTRQSFSLLNTDTTPASFWITNPSNEYVANAAGGSQGYGFWFRLDNHPDGPSSTSLVCPKFMPLGQFDGNSSHSNRFYGVRVHPEWFPVENPCAGNQHTSQTKIPARLTNSRLYKNGMKGFVATQVGLLRLEQAVVFDNGVGPRAHVTNGKDHGGGIEFTWTIDYRDRHTTAIADMPGVKDALVVKESCDDSSPTRMCGSGAYETFSSRGVRGIITNSMEAPDFRSIMSIEGMHFKDWTGGQHIALEACGKCKSKQGGFHTYVASNSVSPAAWADGAAWPPVAYTAGTATVLAANWSWQHQGIYLDTDGTLLGRQGRTLHASNPVIMARNNGECVQYENNGAICHGDEVAGTFAGVNRLEFRRVMLNNHAPGSIQFLPLRLTEIPGPDWADIPGVASEGSIADTYDVNGVGNSSRTSLVGFSKYNSMGYQFTMPVMRAYDLQAQMPGAGDIGYEKFTLHHIDYGQAEDWLLFRTRHSTIYHHITVNNNYGLGLLAPYQTRSSQRPLEISAFDSSAADGPTMCPVDAPPVPGTALVDMNNCAWPATASAAHGENIYFGQDIFPFQDNSVADADQVVWVDTGIHGVGPGDHWMVVQGAQGGNLSMAVKACPDGGCAPPALDASPTAGQITYSQVLRASGCTHPDQLVCDNFANRADGMDLNIPRGFDFVLDETPDITFGEIRIEGGVTVADGTTPITLIANKIIVRDGDGAGGNPGGSLNVCKFNDQPTKCYLGGGTANAWGCLTASTDTDLLERVQTNVWHRCDGRGPVGRDVHFRLTGARTSIDPYAVSNSVIVGDKVIGAAEGGRISMYGRPSNDTSPGAAPSRWFKLGAIDSTAATSSVLTLVDRAGNTATGLNGWKSGMEVLVTSASFNGEQWERAVIVSVDVSAGTVTVKGIDGAIGVSARSVGGILAGSIYDDGAHRVDLSSEVALLGFPSSGLPTGNWAGPYGVPPASAGSTKGFITVSANEAWNLGERAGMVDVANPMDAGIAHRYGAMVVIAGPESEGRLTGLNMFFCGQAGLTEKSACVRFVDTGDTVTSTINFDGTSPTFEVDETVTPPRSYLKDSSIMYAIGSAVQVTEDSKNIAIQDNITHGGWDESTVLITAGAGFVALERNLGLGTRKLDGDDGKSGFDTDNPATFDARIFGFHRVRGNVAAGSERVGFYMAGAFCQPNSAKVAHPDHFSDNQARASLVGWIPTRSMDTCTSGTRFVAARCHDYGILTMRGLPSDLELNEVAVLENRHMGVQPLILSAMTSVKAVKITGSLFAGVADAMGCALCQTQDFTDKTCHQNLSPKSHNKSGTFAGSTALVNPTFALSFSPGPDQKPYDKLMGYNVVNGSLTVTGTTFANFGSGSDAVCTPTASAPATVARALGNHPGNPEAFAPASLEGTILRGVPSAALFLHHDSNPSWRNLSDCGEATLNRPTPTGTSNGTVIELNCTGPRHIAWYDVDGSLTGSVGVVTGRYGAERAHLWEQNSLVPAVPQLYDSNPDPLQVPLWMEGQTVRIETPLLGGEPPVQQYGDDGQPLVTVSRTQMGVNPPANTPTCVHKPDYNAYLCTGGPTGRPAQQIVVESRDADTELRNVSPVFVGQLGNDDILISMMDHGWCFAYTCQKRLSTFHSTIFATSAAGDLGTTVDFTGTPPRTSRYWFQNLDANRTVSIQINYFEPQRRYLWSSSSLRLADHGTIPTTADVSGAGAGGFAAHWDQNTSTFYAVATAEALSGSSWNFEIRTERIVTITMYLAISITDFYEDEFQLNVAALLQVDPSRIVNVRVAWDDANAAATGARKRSLQTGASQGIVVTFDVVEDENMAIPEPVFDTSGNVDSDSVVILPDGTPDPVSYAEAAASRQYSLDNDWTIVVKEEMIHAENELEVTFASVEPPADLYEEPTGSLVSAVKRLVDAGADGTLDEQIGYDVTGMGVSSSDPSVLAIAFGTDSGESRSVAVLEPGQASGTGGAVSVVDGAAPPPASTEDPNAADPAADSTADTGVPSDPSSGVEMLVVGPVVLGGVCALAALGFIARRRSKRDRESSAEGSEEDGAAAGKRGKRDERDYEGGYIPPPAADSAAPSTPPESADGARAGAGLAGLAGAIRASLREGGRGPSSVAGSDAGLLGGPTVGSLGPAHAGDEGTPGRRASEISGRSSYHNLLRRLRNEGPGASSLGLGAMRSASVQPSPRGSEAGGVDTGRRGSDAGGDASTELAASALFRQRAAEAVSASRGRATSVGRSRPGSAASSQVAPDDVALRGGSVTGAASAYGAAPSPAGAGPSRMGAGGDRPGSAQRRVALTPSQQLQAKQRAETLREVYGGGGDGGDGATTPRGSARNLAERARLAVRASAVLSAAAADPSAALAAAAGRAERATADRGTLRVAPASNTREARELARTQTTLATGEAERAGRGADTDTPRVSEVGDATRTGGAGRWGNPLV